MSDKKPRKSVINVGFNSVGIFEGERAVTHSSIHRGHVVAPQGGVHRAVSPSHTALHLRNWTKKLFVSRPTIIITDVIVGAENITECFYFMLVNI